MWYKIPLFWSFYLFGWPKILPASYTFSLSFNCNSHCRTCNIWRKKPAEDLTKEEWRKIFMVLGRSPYWVTLSGGEPFLRRDLVEIVKDLCRVCWPKTITIPTNGILTSKIAADVKKIIDDNPQTHFIVNLSLDGVEGGHDQARGVRGNFRLAMLTFEALRGMRANNLTLGVHTVISKDNVKNFPAICDFILDKLQPDSYVTEIAEERVELDNLSSKITPDLEDYKKAISYLKKRMKQRKQASFVKVIRAFRLSYYDLALKILKEKSQVIPCYAGIASAQVAPNGDVWQCCVRADVLGNLKQEGFDFSKIWFSKKAVEVRKSIKNKECYCPLANASYTNILMSPTALTKIAVNLLR